MKNKMKNKNTQAIEYKGFNLFFYFLFLKINTL
jgi:hypothetical protein